MEEGSLSFAEGDGPGEAGSLRLARTQTGTVLSEWSAFNKHSADNPEAAGALPSKRGDVFQNPRRQLEMEGQGNPVHH